ncbi:D-alanyl-D-alanine carboxypeptidase [Pedobacter sp. UYEF25]
MPKTVFITLMLALTLQQGFSQTSNAAKLDSLFNALDKNDEFMGSVAIAKQGKIIYEKQIGYADLEAKYRPDAATTYGIGSISKTFTTVMVFKAIADGKLKLTDHLDTFFPDIVNAKKITVADLLYHRSGIHNFTDDSTYQTWNTGIKTEKQMINIIAKGGSDFDPDSNAQYSNSNFVLLSFMLQRCYKTNFASLLEKEIVKPLGLKNTYFGNELIKKKNSANSYAFQGKWVKQPVTDPSIPMGAGGIFSTPADLTIFIEALFNGKLVSIADLKQMQTLKDNFGMGLFKIPFYSKFGFGHNGGIDGFTSMLYHFDEDDVAAAIISNGTRTDNNKILIALLTAAYSSSTESGATKLLQLTDEDLSHYTGVYISKQVALKITVTKEGKTLMAQATGQSAIALEATAKNEFRFSLAGIVMEFNPTQKTMLLKQGGAVYQFVLSKSEN